MPPQHFRIFPGLRSTSSLHFMHFSFPVIFLKPESILSCKGEKRKKGGGIPNNFRRKLIFPAGRARTMWEMLGSFPDLSEKLVYLPFYRGRKGFIIISGYKSPSGRGRSRSSCCGWRCIKGRDKSPDRESGGRAVRAADPCKTSPRPGLGRRIRAACR